MKAIVLAAGKGERMQSSKAKVLHKLLGVPILKYVLDTLKEIQLESIYLVVGHSEKDVRAFAKDYSVTFVSQPEQKGTGHAVLLCKKHLEKFKDDVLIIPGDVPLVRKETLKELMSFHKRANSVCTILTTVLSNPIGYGRIVRNKEGKVLRIVEDREANPKEKNITEINSGIYAANSNLLLEMLKRIKPDNKKGEYYLTDAVGMLVDNNLRVETFLCKEPMEVFGINSREDIAILGSWLKGKILQEKMSKGVTIIDPRFTYIEANVTIGTDTIIFPFTVIERDVVIGSHCEIGPFSHIRPGTVIEDYAEIGNFVEVKKSRIGFRSKAKHLSYLGDAIIGKDVNIGAGTITANFDGVKKHTTIIEDGAFTGCNTVLVAPVKMGKYSKTGAGAVVPKGKDVRNGDVVVGIPARSLNKKKR